jgi:hypothetical protein
LRGGVARETASAGATYSPPPLQNVKGVYRRHRPRNRLDRLRWLKYPYTETGRATKRK